ncbi:hypothetical protein DPMN_015620 [Dreissena polymorpha]|uniref:Uncharacterized protein n=1 Tax=Dreissena polymorpha TaxID=45954 RepID=A0A9D4NBC9_DREPO|nr:hypothetical protein DPMN_015620 [Dreissena polymorpha]
MSTLQLCKIGAIVAAYRVGPDRPAQCNCLVRTYALHYTVVQGWCSSKNTE